MDRNGALRRRVSALQSLLFARVQPSAVKVTRGSEVPGGENVFFEF